MPDELLESEFGERLAALDSYCLPAMKAREAANLTPHKWLVGRTVRAARSAA